MQSCHNKALLSTEANKATEPVASSTYQDSEIQNVSRGLEQGGWSSEEEKQRGFFKPL
jgi:hypothetical protein